MLNPINQNQPATGLLGNAAVLGLGYVGAVTAAMLAKQGWRVWGVEANPWKLAEYQAGRCPIREPGLEEELAKATTLGQFLVTADLARAVAASELVLIAVGTPNLPMSAAGGAGGVDLSAIDSITAELAGALARDQNSRVVMVRSTVPPGTTAERIAPLLKTANSHTSVCHHPEFLREGSALRDWQAPALIVSGCAGADRPAVDRMLDRIYQGISEPRLALGLAESELMKYACNVFHALKVDFANEIGSLAQRCGADPQAVMNAFCQDRRLNISPTYLKPGAAFGGSCLPKDTAAMLALARQIGIELPLISAILPSNQAHLERQTQVILAHGKRPTLLLGLSFKSDSDDLRGSPLVILARRLLQEQIPLTIYDPDLDPRQLVGANARQIQRDLPQVELLLRPDLEAAIAAAELVILGKSIRGLQPAMLQGKQVVDLTRLSTLDANISVQTTPPRVIEPSADLPQARAA
ncbi:MAG: UDP-glucose/GDP-mannose dehydrogenase family protein [Phycisphaeraceae bacterium]|nr:UDP-glucose/GDP-mannose dehydrogenase family protein [Phycisphaeraceae bacterium]